MSSSTSIEDNDCGDSLNNSMSLTDLHNTTPTNRTHNTISSNINSTSDLSILPIKESSNNIGSSSNNLMIRKTSSSIDYDSYNKSCGTEHQIIVARTIANDVISAPTHTGHTRSTSTNQHATMNRSKQDVVSRLNKIVNNSQSNNQSSLSQSSNSNPLSNPPNHFKCPISSTLLLDPVIDLEGNTYERTNILKWLVLTSSQEGEGGVSPITGNVLNIDELKDDVVVKSAIDRWKKECWVRFLMSSKAKDEDETGDVVEEEYDDYNEGFDKEKDEDGGGGGLSEVQQMLLASVESDKKLLGNDSNKGGGGIDISERSGKSSTNQKKGGADVSERSGSVSSKKSTKSKSSSKSRRKKKIYSIDGDKLGISLHDDESCDKIDMSDRSAKSERPRSSSGGGLSSELDSFILKNKKAAARKNGGSVSHASHISGASQVSTTKDEVVKSQVIKKKGSKSPYRKGGQPPPPPPPPKKHSPSNSSSSFGSKKQLPLTPSITKRPKDEQHRNKSISSSQTTTETSSTTPTRPRSTTSTTPRDNMRPPPLTAFSVPTKQEDGSNIAELSRSHSTSLTQESSVPVRDVVPQHNRDMSSASSFCSNLSGNFSDMMSLSPTNDDLAVFNQPTTRTRPQHNGWSVPLGVHRVTCAMPGLQVTTQVHRRSIPVKVNRTVMSNYGTCEVEKQNMIISPGSYVEVVETQVHGDRVRGRICWEEEEEDTDAQPKKKKTIKKRISRQIKRTTRRGREGNKRGKSKEKVMKIVTYEGWISLQWAKDDDKNEDLEKLEESRIGMDTDEDVGPWTEPVPLGVYRINFSGGLPLRQSSERESDVIGKLDRGRCVEVVQTEVKGDRVRARVIVPSLPSQDDESTGGGQVKFTSGWVSLLNALTGSSGASLVPLGAYVVVAEPGCVITEGGRLDSKVKGKLIPGSCCEVVATRMEEGVVRGLLEEGGHVTLFAPPRGSVTTNANNSNGARKQDTGRMFAMPVPLGTYQIIHNGLLVTADISVTSSTQTKLQHNTNVEVLETRVDEGRVRGRICTVIGNNERQIAAGSCAGSTTGGSQAGMIIGWINLFEPNQRWAKIVSFKGGRPVKVDSGVPRRKNSHV